MKTLFHCLIVVAVGVAIMFAVDGCTHRNDYKVASNELTIIGSNLVGDIKAVTADNDTVFVYGKYSTLLPLTEVWQTKFYYLEPIGFTRDSVVVKPF